MKVLFLDDRSERVQAFRERCASHVEVRVARSAGEAIYRLAQGRYDVAFLDHDLNDEPHVEPCHRLYNCGMTVARFLACGPCLTRKFVVHSNNHAAARVMRDMLNNCGYEAWRCPFEDYGWAHFLLG